MYLALKQYCWFGIRVVQVHVHLHNAVILVTAGLVCGVCLLCIREHKINASTETVSVCPSACLNSVPNEIISIIFDTESSRSNIVG